MYDGAGASQGAHPGRPPWILLIHHIPPKPDYLRIKVRRRLQRIGAVALKNSVYVLPHTDDALEDFEWVRRIVTDEGGEATICAASFLGGVTDDAVRSMFREQSDAEYRELLAKARATATSPTETEVARLREQLRRIAARDHFDAELGEEAAGAVRHLEALLAGDGEETTMQGERPHPPRGTTWVTRTGIKVDRMASAWLIRRFIDEDAQFKFVPPEGHVARAGEVRFDMFEGEFTHEGEDCTFEGLVKRFIPADHALRQIAEIVHDVDCKDGKFGRDEASGVETMVRGIVASHAEDVRRLDAGMALFDGLYASFQAKPV